MGTEAVVTFAGRKDFENSLFGSQGAGQQEQPLNTLGSSGTSSAFEFQWGHGDTTCELWTRKADLPDTAIEFGSQDADSGK